MVKECPTKYPDAADHVLIETFENILLKYNKREIAGAEKARQILGKMEYLLVRNAMDIATKGTNFDVAARDFAIAEDIYGMDMASLKNKTKKMATTIADITIGAEPIQAEQILSLDIMSVEGVPSLIGLPTPQDLTMATSLSAVVVKKAIDSFIATLAFRNFVTRLIMSDGEGAIDAIKDGYWSGHL